MGRQEEEREEAAGWKKEKGGKESLGRFFSMVF
jgi:hypothetical protein